MALPMRRGRGMAAPMERRMPPYGGWDPFGEIEDMWRNMGRLMTAQPTTTTGAWMPMAEEEETEDAYMVRCELPGVPADNVDISIEGNELSITGEISEEKRGKALTHRTGRFFYRSMLPSDADSENVEADLTDGILTVRIPKSTEGKRRKIQVGSGHQIKGETA